MAYATDGGQVMDDVTEVEKWENAALRLFGNRSIRVSSAMLRDKAMELAGALEAAEKDSERLDWLDAQRGKSGFYADLDWPGYSLRLKSTIRDSVRDAIDLVKGARDDR
jgi:hypothetical protein